MISGEPLLDLLVCCRDPQWRAKLRSSRPAEWRWRTQTFQELKSLVDAARNLANSFSLIEVLEAGQATSLAEIDRLSRLPGTHRLACVGKPELAGCETLLRQAGATICAFSFSQWDRVFRCLTRHRASLPPLRIPLEQAIIERLPLDLPISAGDRHPRSP
jgi:hypothetical protein